MYPMYPFSPVDPIESGFPISNHHLGCGCVRLLYLLYYNIYNIYNIIHFIILLWPDFHQRGPFLDSELVAACGLSTVQVPLLQELLLVVLPRAVRSSFRPPVANPPMSWTLEVLPWFLPASPGRWEFPIHPRPMCSERPQRWQSLRIANCRRRNSQASIHWHFACQGRHC